MKSGFFARPQAARGLLLLAVLGAAEPVRAEEEPPGNLSLGDQAGKAQILSREQAKDFRRLYAQLRMADLFSAPAFEAPGKIVRPLPPADVKRFDAALANQVVAERKLGSISSKESFDTCWNETRSAYLNRDNLRRNRDFTLPELVRNVWFDCKEKYPESMTWQDSIENLVPSAVFWTVVAGGGGLLWTVAKEAVGAAKDAAAVVLIGDIVRSYTDPVTIPFREYTGVAGRRHLRTPSIRLGNYFAAKIRDSQKSLRQLDLAVDALNKAQNAYDRHTALYDRISFPRLTVAEMESDYRDFDNWFIEAVQMWDAALMPNSQTGRHVVLESSVFRLKNFAGDMGIFQTKRELYRQALEQQLPLLVAEPFGEQRERVIRLAQDMAARTQASELAPNLKTRQLELIAEKREQSLAQLAREKQELELGLRRLLSATEEEFVANHRHLQQSNTFIQRIKRKLTNLGLPLEQVGEIAQGLRERRSELGTPTPAELEESRSFLVDKLAEAKPSPRETERRLIDEAVALLESEALSRRDNWSKLQAARGEKMAQVAFLETKLPGAEQALGGLLAQQHEMLIAQQQMVASAAGQRLHDKMFPEFNRNLPENVEQSFRTMQKEMAFSHFAEQLQDQVIDLMHEMGLELNENGEIPSRGEVFDQLKEKIEKDRFRLWAAARKLTATAVRDATKRKLAKLFGIEIAEKVDVETAKAVKTFTEEGPEAVRLHADILRAQAERAANPPPPREPLPPSEGFDAARCQQLFSKLRSRR